MRLTILGLLAGIFFAVSGALEAEAGPASFTFDRQALPGEGRGDYLLVDPVHGRLFVTHSQSVHILDLKSLRPLGEVTGLGAAHGVAADGAGHAYVTDGKNNSVVMFDPANGRTLARIKVGSGPDSIVFDSASSKILAFNGESEDVSVIDPATASVVKTIKLPNSPEFSQADGRGHVYVNLEGNDVGVIDTAKLVLDHLIPLTGCYGPAALAIDKTDRRLFSGCGNKRMVVSDADSGKVVASVPIGGGPDGIVYDSGTRRIVVANRDGGWTVVRQLSVDRYQVEQILKIDQYAKTVALDPATHRIFTSTADLVWPPAVPGKKHLPNAKSGTFRLLVVSQH